MPSYRMLLALVGALLTLVRPATAQERTKDSAVAAREGIEAIEARLASAVDRVSLPHAARLLGRVESARGYRLPGYGLVLVLTPRMLPAGEGQVYVLRRGAPKHRVRIESRQPSTGEPTWTVDDEQVETFERQVLVLQHETEAARSAAEEEMERMVEDVRVRVTPPSQVRVEVHTAVPEAQAPPAPPQAHKNMKTAAAPTPASQRRACPDRPR